jgi:DNA-binding transcriptional ArsR family regulator
MPNLDAMFSALADPTRRAIVARLTRGEATIMELAEPFDLSQPAVSRHIKVLEESGLLRRRAEGTKRHCSLQTGALDELEQWLTMLRTALDANCGRLDALLLATASPKISQSAERKKP